jgi:uncharacterized protein YjbI with pentapeptide repeats
LRCLSFLNLSGQILHIADLFGAQMNNADLQRADLQRADLGSANLAGADLAGANLERTRLTDRDQLRGAQGEYHGTPQYLDLIHSRAPA